MNYQSKSFKKFLAATAATAVVASAVFPTQNAVASSDKPYILTFGLKNGERLNQAKHSLRINSFFNTVKIVVKQNGKTIKTIKGDEGYVNINLNKSNKKGKDYLNTFAIYATDKTGKTSKKVIRVYYDVTAPSIKTSGLKNGQRLKNPNQKLNVRTSTDVTKIVIKQNGKVIKTISDLKGSTNIKLIPGKNNMNNPTNTFAIYATDKAGNTTQKVIRVVYDTEGPDIQIIGMHNKEVYHGFETKKTIKIRTSSDTNTKTVKVLHNGKELKSIGGTVVNNIGAEYNINLRNGYNDIFVSAEDKLGNKSEYLMTVTYSQPLEVPIVQSINSKQILITYNQDLDKFTGSIEIIGDSPNKVVKREPQNDNRSFLITLEKGYSERTNITVNGDGFKLAEDTRVPFPQFSTTITVNDTTAPEILNISASTNTNKAENATVKLS